MTGPTRTTEAALAARADLLVRIVAHVLDTARPALASNARMARLALDELGAVAKGLAGPYSCCNACRATCNACHAPDSTSRGAADPIPRESVGLCPETIERLARAAALPEFGALEFRRKAGQQMTEPERADWLRIERFAGLVATAAIDTPSLPRASGTGPVVAT